MEQCLVLRLAGPLQSWGGPSKFASRRTKLEPTKSGIVGLLAAADGRRRSDDIEDLLRIQIAVRTDQPGSIMVDYHTVSNLSGSALPTVLMDKKGFQKLRTPDGKTLITHRFYLQDAIFVVALRADSSMLLGLREALLNPYFPLALGRRSCPPTLPLILDPIDFNKGVSANDNLLWDTDLLSTLKLIPWQASESYRRNFDLNAESVNVLVTYDNTEGTEINNDVPTSFAPESKTFRTRRVSRTFVDIPVERSQLVSEHNPYDLLN